MPLGVLRVAEGAKIRTKPPRVGVLPLGCGCFYACQFLTGSGKLLLLHLIFAHECLELLAVIELIQNKYDLALVKR